MPWAELSYRFDPQITAVNEKVMLRLSNAEQAKQTGGMIALYPRQDDAMKLAISGGEDPSELHLTLGYLGEDVSDSDPGHLLEELPRILDPVTVITAKIMGHALFNPNGGDDPEEPKDPCAVYLVGDSEQIPDLHTDIMDLLDRYGVDYPVPAQHKPFLPHITAGYSLPIDALSYTGPVLFDRVGLTWGSHAQYFPLTGATTPAYSS
jgi:2'-5' RNA ligase